MVALFPFKVDKTCVGYSLVSIWKYHQCLLCDPLCADLKLMDNILKMLVKKMKILSIDIEYYSNGAYGQWVNNKSCSVYYNRGAIFSCQKIKDHFDSLPRKIRSENKRIKTRLFNLPNVNYITSSMDQNINWLKAYCELEHKGWKGKVKGSIYSQQKMIDYYEALCEHASQTKRIEFQGIFLNQKPIAISFRLVYNNFAYDLKTTYDEDYRHLYPGVVLEIINLEDLENYDYQLIDSCTASDNKVINRLWSDKRNVFGSIFFSDYLLAKLLRQAYRFKKLVKSDRTSANN
jgi:hypothetical protein